MPLHPAFRPPVQWLPHHGDSVDRTGHGTHVCGSVVGDGMTTDGIPVRGTDSPYVAEYTYIVDFAFVVGICLCLYDTAEAGEEPLRKRVK